MSALPANFLAAVSHEMRSPLHAISGLTEELLVGELDDAQERLVAAIQRAAHVMSVLVDDVVAFGKSESGQLEIHESPFSPGRLCSRVVEAFRHDAEARGLTLLADVGPGLARSLRGDETRIGQVLTNLVSNALKYTPAGSVILSARDLDGGVVFAVADTGVGVPSNELEALFVPFAQAHGATSSATGTGLGLAISQRLVGLMGSELLVESVEGVGSTFSFALQLEASAGEGDAGAGSVGRHRAAGTAAAGGESQGRVLVVDDGATNQLLATTQLHRLGYAAVVASSGEEALDILSAESFDAVLMDWHMPGIDGLETTRRFRAMEEVGTGGRLPIIAVTASAMPGDREACLAAGMDAYLAKPVGAADLEFVLKKWCPQSNHRVEGRPTADADLPASSASAVAARSAPLIDAQILAALADQVNDGALFASLVDTFANELVVHRTTIASGMVSDVTRAAHTVKSTARTFGAIPLADAAELVEKSSRAADSISDGARQELCDAIDRTFAALTLSVSPFLPQPVNSSPQLSPQNEEKEVRQ